MNYLQFSMNYFKSRMLLLLIVTSCVYGLIVFVEWAFVNAVFNSSLQACQQLMGVGACWGVITEKWKLIFFGRYPVEALWRAVLLTGGWSFLLFLTCFGLLRAKALFMSWAIAIVLGLVLMYGGVFGLKHVPTHLWAGLPLTLIIPVICLLLAFPMAVLLAIGRLSKHRPLKWFCAIYIDFLRAIPLISVLFLAAFVLPLILPGDGIDLLLRVLLLISLFAAAYLAEVIRGGLQAIPKGQMASARALGLTLPQAYSYVVLPQALRACMPGLVNSFVTLFKESSLVSIVGLFELMGGLSLALSGDVNWRQFYFEAYLVLAIIYWLYCSLIGRAANARLM